MDIPPFASALPANLSIETAIDAAARKNLTAAYISSMIAVLSRHEIDPGVYRAIAMVEPRAGKSSEWQSSILAIADRGHFSRSVSLEVLIPQQHSRPDPLNFRIANLIENAWRRGITSFIATFDERATPSSAHERLEFETEARFWDEPRN